MKFGALRGIEITGLERGQKLIRVVLLRLDHDPAAEMIGFREMRIIGGTEGEATALGQQQIKRVEPVRTVAARGTTVIVDFDRVCGLDTARIRKRES